MPMQAVPGNLECIEMHDPMMMNSPEPEQDTILGSSPEKDSGFESSTEDISCKAVTVITEDQLMKIRLQIEFYLSDDVITKDQFLMKHVKKSKEGWISLKLMSSFRKVKSLCKSQDWRIVAEALKGSETIEVNQEGTKLRRKHAIPEEDETKPSRTLILFSEDRVPSIENLTEVFNPCGASHIRLIKPDEQVDDTTRKFFLRFPRARALTCAVVEFEKSENAVKSMQIECGLERIYLKECLKMKVPQHTVTRERRTQSDTQVIKQSKSSGDVHSWRHDNNNNNFINNHKNNQNNTNSKKSQRDNPQQHNLNNINKVIKSHSQGDIAPELRKLRERNHHNENNSRNNNCNSKRFDREKENKDYKISKKNTKDTKITEVKEEEPVRENRPRRFTTAEHAMPVASCILRQPRGPDGSKGFTSRPISCS